MKTWFKVLLYVCLTMIAVGAGLFFFYLNNGSLVPTIGAGIFGLGCLSMCIGLIFHKSGDGPK